MPKIQGGYILLARTLTQSELWGKPPYYIKLWVWLLLKCNHRNVKNNGHSYNRGEALITLEETIENSKFKVGWRTEKISKDKAWRFYEDLREANMITTRNTTRGMFVKVLNYNQFQDPANYESNNEKSTNPIRTQRTSNIINKNDKNEKNDNKNDIYINSLTRIAEHFNTTFSKNIKVTKAWSDNAVSWLDIYSVQEVLDAISKWKDNGWWADPNITLLFRTKNRQGPCDYIGELLNSEKKGGLI